MEGNLRAKVRVSHARDLLAQMGINPDRIRMYNVAASDGPRFVEIAKEMTEHIRQLGPSPVLTQSGPEWPIPKETQEQHETDDQQPKAAAG